MNGPFDREGFFTLLRQQWHAPSRFRRDAFAQHAEELVTIYDRLRATPSLAYLSNQFYPEWQAVKDIAPPVPEEDSDAFHHGFYLCNSMIQLMEVVYLDLNLDQEHGHPDNRGWMNLFRHWAWSPMFRLVWASCIGTYGGRFQSFCERHFVLWPGNIVALGLNLDLQGAIAEAEPKPPTGLKKALDLSGTERGLIGRFLECDHNQACAQVLSLHVYRLISRVELGPTLEDYDLPFGFCVTGNSRVEPSTEYRLYLRVRDHLRGAGLAGRTIQAYPAWAREPPPPLNQLRIPDDIDQERWCDIRGKRL